MPNKLRVWLWRFYCGMLIEFACPFFSRSKKVESRRCYLLAAVDVGSFQSKQRQTWQISNERKSPVSYDHGHVPLPGPRGRKYTVPGLPEKTTECGCFAELKIQSWGPLSRKKKLRFSGLGTELVLTDLNVAPRWGQALIKTWSSSR